MLAVELATILPFLIFAAITVGIIAVFTLVSGRDDRTTERLEELRDPRRRSQRQEEEDGVTGMLKKAAPQLSKALKPKTELEENKLKVDMANAGFSSPNAPMFFLAIRTACLLGGALLGGALGVFRSGVTVGAMYPVVIAGGLGFYLPLIILTWMRWKRMERIFLSLPDALDLLVVCVEAGLGLDAAMRRVAEELEDAAPDVCAEMSMCNLQLQMGRPRRDVLHDLGVRTGVDDMKSLVAILIQADKFGSSIAQALRVQSDSMRIKRQHLAEEKAQQTAVKLIFPLVLFIFPGIFTVLVGPAAILLMRNLMTMN